MDIYRHIGELTRNSTKLSGGVPRLFPWGRAARAPGEESGQSPGKNFVRIYYEKNKTCRPHHLNP